MQADAQLKVALREADPIRGDFGQSFQHLKCGTAGVFRVIRLIGRSVPHGHQTVTKVVHDQTVVIQNGFREAVENVPQHFASQRVGRERHDKLGGCAQVGDEERHLSLFGACVVMNRAIVHLTGAGPEIEQVYSRE